MQEAVPLYGNLCDWADVRSSRWRWRRSGTAVTVSLSAAALKPWLMIAAVWQRGFSCSLAHSAHVDKRGKNGNRFHRATLQFPQWHIWILSLRCKYILKALCNDLRWMSHVLCLLPASVSWQWRRRCVLSSATAGASVPTSATAVIESVQVAAMDQRTQTAL